MTNKESKHLKLGQLIVGLFILVCLGACDSTSPNGDLASILNGLDGGANDSTQSDTDNTETGVSPNDTTNSDTTSTDDTDQPGTSPTDTVSTDTNTSDTENSNTDNTDTDNTDTGTSDTGNSDTDNTDTGCVDMDNDEWCENFDCNDTDSSINKDQPEVLGNNIDDNCDGQTDESTSTDTGTIQCAETPHEVEFNPINMLILLDRSRSMENNTVGSQTYAEIVADAINQVVTANTAQSRVNFGLAVFPSPSCPANADDNPDEKCNPATTSDNPLVPIGDSNASEIATQLSSIGTCGGTPICDSLQWTRSYLTTLSGETKNRPTYVLLATDGAPNCNEMLNATSCTCTSSPCSSGIQCLDDQCSFNQAYALSNSFPLFVVGVGDGVTEYQDTMTKIAQYGQGNDTDADYYPASDPATLVSVLQEITGGLISCELSVDWNSVPDSSENGPVDKKCDKIRVYTHPRTAPSTSIPIPYSEDCSDSSGWRWKGLTGVNGDTPLTTCTTVELCAEVCSGLKDLTYGEITTSFGCGLIIS